MERQTTHIKKILRKATASELREKAVYMKKEINTANPSGFFRNLMTGAMELGYKIDENIENKIWRGELREADYTNIPHSGIKTVVKKGHRNTLLIAGAVTMAFGVLLFFLIPPLGILAIGLGELSFILWLQGVQKSADKNKKPATRVSRIWVMLESKGQQVKSTKPEDQQPTNPRNKMSEFIVHLAGDSNSENDVLQAEMQTLMNRIEYIA